MIAQRRTRHQLIKMRLHGAIQPGFGRAFFAALRCALTRISRSANSRGPGCSPFGGVIIARTHYGQRDTRRARRPGRASSRRHRMAMRRPLPRLVGTRGTPSRPLQRPPLAYAPTCQHQARQVSLRPREWIEESTIRATNPSGPLHSATFAEAKPIRAHTGVFLVVDRLRNVCRHGNPVALDYPGAVICGAWPIGLTVHCAQSGTARLEDSE